MIRTQIILSPEVVAELYAGVKRDNELAVLDNFVTHFRVVALSSVHPEIGKFGRDQGVREI